MSNGLNNDFFADLVKDTDFKIAETGSLMNSRIKVHTPLYVLNCIFGGGIPLGIMAEVSGEPGSGKSTFLYQCMGNYQKQYPNGVPVILDMEGSMDSSRLHTLGVDTNRVLRLPATSMENAFSSMFTMFNKLEKLYETNKDISTFMVYDSIGAGGTDKQAEAVEAGENAFGAGAMMSPQRIVKQNLSAMLPYMEKLPAFVAFVNQVFTQINSYGMASVKSGGGFGLKHFTSAHLMFSRPKDEVNKQGFLLGSNSKLTLQKCRMSPKLSDIPVYIDATNGGRIDEIKSFYEYLINVELIKTGSWYKLGDYVKEMIDRYPCLAESRLMNYVDKNIRKDDMMQLFYDDEALLKFFEIAVINYICDIYPGQAEIAMDYAVQLMNECEFFDNSTNELKLGEANVNREDTIIEDHVL